MDKIANFVDVGCTGVFGAFDEYKYMCLVCLLKCTILPNVQLN